MHTFLITGTLAAAHAFAKALGWEMRGGGHRLFYDKYDPILATNSQDDLLAVSPGDAVVHVGYFEKTREAQAQRRSLVRTAEMRGFHLVHYDLSGQIPSRITQCLVCGAAAPCMRESDLVEGEADIPCSFNPSPYDLYKLIHKLERNHAELQRSLKVVAEQAFKLAQLVEALQKEVAIVRRSGTKVSRFSHIEH